MENNQTKKCSTCYITKDIQLFNKDKTVKDGIHGCCKKCSSDYALKSSRTKHGVMSLMYTYQIGNSKRRKHNPPTYTKQELKDWLSGQELFHILYDNWVDSGYEKDLKPSVDRKDNHIGYTMDNIQLMTWAENNEKGYCDMRSSDIIVTSNPQKIVLQFSIDMLFIKEHVSVNDASRNTGVSSASISIACNKSNPHNHTKEYFWMFKN